MPRVKRRGLLDVLAERPDAPVAAPIRSGPGGERGAPALPLTDPVLDLADVLDVLNADGERRLKARKKDKD